MLHWCCSRFGIAFLLTMFGFVNVAEAARERRQDVEEIRAQPLIRGAVVFKSYCVMCHGEAGDGVARATKLYGQMNLVIMERSSEFYEKIIRVGGLGVGLSKFMPAWKDELTDEQIKDVAVYLSAVGSPEKRGEAVFKTNCILCHGIKGNGKGRAAVLYDPPPADLTRSDKNDDYKRLIITMGGKAMGRSEVMPVWGKQLTVQEIDDVVVYLRTIVMDL